MGVFSKVSLALCGMATGVGALSDTTAASMHNTTTSTGTGTTTASMHTTTSTGTGTTTTPSGEIEVPTLIANLKQDAELLEACIGTGDNVWNGLEGLTSSECTTLATEISQQLQQLQAVQQALANNPQFAFFSKFVEVLIALFDGMQSGDWKNLFSFHGDDTVDQTVPRNHQNFQGLAQQNSQNLLNLVRNDQVKALKFNKRQADPFKFGRSIQTILGNSNDLKDLTELVKLGVQQDFKIVKEGQSAAQTFWNVVNGTGEQLMSGDITLVYGPFEDRLTAYVEHKAVDALLQALSQNFDAKKGMTGDDLKQTIVALLAALGAWRKTLVCSVQDDPVELPTGTIVYDPKWTPEDMCVSTPVGSTTEAPATTTTEAVGTTTVAPVPTTTEAVGTTTVALATPTTEAVGTTTPADSTTVAPM